MACVVRFLTDAAHMVPLIISACLITACENDAAPSVQMSRAAVAEQPKDIAPAVRFSRSEIRRMLNASPLPDPPRDSSNRFADDQDAARFGQFLFYEERLSPSGTISCATCHDPSLGFSNGERFGRGMGETARHVQSLWNVAYNRWFYWDGSADSAWAQALRPLERPLEMDSDRLHVVRTVANDDAMRAGYERVFGAMPAALAHHALAQLPDHACPMPGDDAHPRAAAWAALPADTRDALNEVFVNIAKAIAAYERLLISRDAPLDHFVAAMRAREEGAVDPLHAISEFPEAAQRGAKLFFGRANCWLCHGGPGFTDGEFHSLGLPLPPGQTRPAPDPGRFAGIDLLLSDPFNRAGAFSDEPGEAAGARLHGVLRSPETWGQFKTPSLRSVATSPPYMHTGQFATLGEVVHFYSTLEGQVQMGHHQERLLQPLELSDGERADLIAFLESLTGNALPESLVTQPAFSRIEPAGSER